MRHNRYITVDEREISFLDPVIPINTNEIRLTDYTKKTLGSKLNLYFGNSYIPMIFELKVGFKQPTGKGNGDGTLNEIKNHSEVYIFFRKKQDDDTSYYAIKTIIYRDIKNNRELSKRARNLLQQLNGLKTTKNFGLENLVIEN